jgi:hypothetical protein
MQYRLLSSREVEGNGPMKPGNPPAIYCGKGANSGGTFRKMRGISHNTLKPLKSRGLFLPSAVNLHCDLIG